MKKFILDFLPFAIRRATRTVAFPKFYFLFQLTEKIITFKTALPITIKLNKTHRNVSCSTWKKYSGSFVVILTSVAVDNNVVDIVVKVSIVSFLGFNWSHYLKKVYFWNTFSYLTSFSQESWKPSFWNRFEKSLLLMIIINVSKHQLLVILTDLW